MQPQKVKLPEVTARRHSDIQTSLALILLSYHSMRRSAQSVTISEGHAERFNHVR